MYQHTTQTRVRYGETDQMGVVYYGNYALYFEMGRTEALRSLGYDYKSLEEKGIMLPVINMSSKYLRSAKYDDIITIHTTIQPLQSDSKEITFISEIKNEKGKLLNIGEVTLVFYNQQQQKTMLIPQEILQAIQSGNNSEKIK